MIVGIVATLVGAWVVVTALHQSFGVGYGIMVAMAAVIIVVAGSLLHRRLGRNGTGSAPEYTMAHYERVSAGMTADEVVRIMGGPGAEISRLGTGVDSTATIGWLNKDGSFLRVVYRGGVVAGKEQSGLRSEET
ncbi:MAG: hypothetical protein JW990_12925 [Thermoleophilia bacterium]|nr:hypothetical protein [Thermoleophilia bacterium]